jgi:FtsP/CotA-like multicopper oxidase with cupredoxin domain
MTRKFPLRKTSSVLAIVVMLSMLIAMVPMQVWADSPQANNSQLGRVLPPQNIIYDLYATDGYWTMADGLAIYSYGFIGGREGTDIQYLDTSYTYDGTPTPSPTFNTLKPYHVASPTPGTGGTEMALAGNAQFPAPLIYCAVGDTVTIRLKNLGITNPNAAGNDPHTIHLHGLDVDVANDGVPETSVAAIPAGVPVDGPFTLSNGAGNVVVYKFTPKVAATYFYHCHQEADIHVNMGMMGALIVYNKTDAGRLKGPGYSGNLFGTGYDKDVVMLLDDTNVAQHDSEAGSVSSLPGQTLNFDGLTANEYPAAPIMSAGDYNPVDYQPQYWFINNISFPMTVHGNAYNLTYADWIQAHPGYDPLITGSVSKKDKVLLRVINMGFETQPMHMHGFHGKILGSDQRAWDWASQGNNAQIGQGLEKNTLTVGSGETYEWLINFGTVETTSTYAKDSQTRYDGSQYTPARQWLTLRPPSL